MKSENRKSSASGRAAKHGAAVATETTVADAEYASQLLAAAEALDAGAAAGTTEAAKGVSGSADATSAVIMLPAQCVIRDAADLKKQLLQRIDAVEAVHIDATQLERIDAAAMQVLLAFAIDRSKQQHHVEWRGVNSVLNDAATALGLNKLLNLPAVEQAA